MLKLIVGWAVVSRLSHHATDQPMPRCQAPADLVDILTALYGSSMCVICLPVQVHNLHVEESASYSLAVVSLCLVAQ